MPETTPCADLKEALAACLAAKVICRYFYSSFMVEISGMRKGRRMRAM